LPPDGSNREFNTPGLLGIASTGPFFHDNSADTLRDAVAFYATIDFLTSPAGLLLPEFSAFTQQDTDDITAFLEAISVDPPPAVPSSSPWSISLLVALLLATPALVGGLRRFFLTR
jgi:cytochrome c peroxidase